MSCIAADSSLSLLYSIPLDEYIAQFIHSSVDHTLLVFILSILKIVFIHVLYISYVYTLHTYFLGIVWLLRMLFFIFTCFLENVYLYTFGRGVVSAKICV